MVLRNTVLIIVILMLSACAGGLSGIVGSSVPGHYLVYKVSYPADGRELTLSSEEVIDNQFFSQRFKKIYGWRKLWFNNVRVATFRQKYKGNYIRIDAEISEEFIILMSTSYSEITKNVFDRLESGLIELYGEANVEKCFGTKDIYSHGCFNTPSGR